jgi:hypothetical protein
MAAQCAIKRPPPALVTEGKSAQFAKKSFPAAIVDGSDQRALTRRDIRSA